MQLDLSYCKYLVWRKSMTKLTSGSVEFDSHITESDIKTTTLSELASRLKSDPSNDGIMGTPSDYVLIAMIIAMMFCMTLCCLCLFCRSSNRLSICGVNFEFNERRSSVENIENQSEIHEVVPLTPTTAGDYNNRLPDIESMLRGDAPPPLYNEIVKKVEASDNAKSLEARDSVKKKKTGSDSSSLKSGGVRNSWRFSGRGILASFRAKSSIIRGRTSDSAIQCPTVEEVCNKGRYLPPTMEESTPRSENNELVTVETVNEITKQQKKVFVYDVNDLNRDEDDDVFV